MMNRNRPFSFTGLRRMALHFSISSLPLMAVALLALCLSAPMANAQFSGPAVNTSSSINTTVTPTTDPAILYPASRDILLQQGDLLAVHLYGSTDYSPSVRVSLDGSIQLPLIGRLHVEGLTVHEAERLIATRLKDAG